MITRVSAYISDSFVFFEESQVSVRIRMKKMGRTHRAFFRICAMDKRKPRNGEVLEELGTYNPFVADTDARALLNKERIDYWLSVGAQPSDKVAVLIKKYGTDGTNLAAQESALAKMSGPKVVPAAPVPVKKLKTKEEIAAEAKAIADKLAEELAAKEAAEAAENAATEGAEAPAEAAAAAETGETPATEAPATEENKEQAAAE